MHRILSQLTALHAGAAVSGLIFNFTLSSIGNYLFSLFRILVGCTACSKRVVYFYMVLMVLQKVKDSRISTEAELFDSIRLQSQIVLIQSKQFYNYIHGKAHT